MKTRALVLLLLGFSLVSLPTRLEADTPVDPTFRGGLPGVHARRITLDESPPQTCAGPPSDRVGGGR